MLAVLDISIYTVKLWTSEAMLRDACWPPLAEYNIDMLPGPTVRAGAHSWGRASAGM